MRIMDLQSSRLDEAFELFATAYKRQCGFVKALDASNAEAEKVLPKLRWCLEKHQGVAAYENDRMTGYMTGFYIDEFLSMNKGAYSPEWANCSIESGAFEIYRRMYQKMGQIWVDDGCLTHAVNTMDHAKGAHEAFFWNGFGSNCIDAMRTVEPFGAAINEKLSIRTASTNDILSLLQLIEGHNFHIALSPAFKPYMEEDRVSEEEMAEWLGRDENHAWIARYGETPVGYMKISSCEDGAAWMVNGNGKLAVNGAYVNPEFRSKGIAGALLNTIMVWAGKQGYERCSVDFEATNLEACSFWLKYFQPVCRSMVRRLDGRILKTLH